MTLTVTTKYQSDHPAVDAAARELLADHPHPLLFAPVWGSKLYGFDTTCSDRDVRGAHVIPAEMILGLDEPKPSIVRTGERARRIEISTHDVRKYFAMLLNHNGNVLEEIFSPLIILTSQSHLELQEVAAGCLTRRHASHYKGMARQAIKALGREERPGVKHALHMYRALMTGIRLMRTGDLEPHLPTLNLDVGLEQVDRLLARRRYEEPPALMGQPEVLRCRLEGERLIGQLEEAAERSVLPREPAGRAGLNDLLIRLRKQHANS